MSHIPCDRAALTEALFDGRLGPPELASAERHVKTCPGCAGLLRDLHATRDALRAASKAPLPLEHQRARLGLLRKAAAPPLPRRRPAWQIAAAITAAPMALLAASSLLGPSLRPGSQAPAALSTSAAPGACAAPPPGASAPASPQDPPATSAPPTPPTQQSAPALAGDAARPRRASPSAPAASTPVASAPTALAPAALAPAASTPAAASAAAAVSARSPSASREFAEAMDSLSRGDFSASAGKLEGFAAAHPKDTRVEEALYLEAIALERAGRAADAKAAARRYLAAYPEGAHRAQARRIAGD